MPSPENFEVIFANTYEPTGPMGAKGIGEAAFNPAPAAVADAIYDATGVRFTRLPISPEDILNALESGRQQVGCSTMQPKEKGNV